MAKSTTHMPIIVSTPDTSWPDRQSSQLQRTTERAAVSMRDFCKLECYLRSLVSAVRLCMAT